MDITIILCTYNRSETLARALGTLAVQEMPASIQWEVLVVDNNSSDNTRAVVAEFCQKHPDHFRYLFEARQGKSYALNAAIKHARGEILAFTDDDILADRFWLQNLAAPLRTGAWAGVGGQILPEAGFQPPHWIPIDDPYSLAPLAVFTPNLSAGDTTETPFGANMAFRRRCFEKYGGFRTDLGPMAHGSAPQKSEDSEFGHRLLRAGEKLRYEPSAIVYHTVPAHRLQKKYFLDWWQDKARADLRAFGVRSGGNYSICGVPLYLFRRLAVWSLRWLLTFRSSKRFSCKLKVWIKASEIAECYRQSHPRTVAATAELA